MKKITIFISLLIVICTIFFLGFSDKPSISPDTYYKVYLEDHELGTVKSKEELEKYIDKQGELIKKRLNVKKVYSPNGLKIKKITTYNNKLDSNKEIYRKIKKLKPFTVKGYQFTIKQNKDKFKIYVLDKNIFKESIDKVIAAFIGKDNYKSYKNKTQKEIETTGTQLENVYLSNDITVKNVYIPVSEKIYDNSDNLSRYLLFGDNEQKTYYTVQPGDTVDKIAFNNKVTVEELLVSNPEISSEKALLYQGQQVTISYLDTKVNVISESHQVSDVESNFRIEEKYDPNRLVGDDLITQNGENGLERVTQKVKSENGVIVYIEQISKEELKPTVNQVVIRGKKTIPNVGTLTNWAWPTSSGYRITSNYAYRIHPIKKIRQLHPALDIYAGPVGSPVYSSNNGVVYSTKCDSSYGNCIIINHNNGYYTLYAHLSKKLVNVGQVVSKGQRIGNIGMTGSATGPHLHYEMWRGGAPWKGGTNINPHVMHG